MNDRRELIWVYCSTCGEWYLESTHEHSCIIEENNDELLNELDFDE